MNSLCVRTALHLGEISYTDLDTRVLRKERKLRLKDGPEQP